MNRQCNVQVLLGFLGATLTYSCDENADALNKKHDIFSSLSAQLRLEAIRIYSEFEELAQDLLDGTNFHTVWYDIWLSKPVSCSCFPIEEYPRYSQTLRALSRNIHGFSEIFEFNGTLFPKQNGLDGQNEIC